MTSHESLVRESPCWLVLAGGFLLFTKIIFNNILLDNSSSNFIPSSEQNMTTIKNISILKLPIFLSILAAISLIVGQYCMITAGEEPFACIPLFLPAGPFVYFTNLFGIQQEALLNMGPMVDILGSALVWFMIGLVLALLKRYLHKYDVTLF